MGLRRESRGYGGSSRECELPPFLRCVEVPGTSLNALARSVSVEQYYACRGLLKLSAHGGGIKIRGTLKLL